MGTDRCNTAVPIFPELRLAAPLLPCSRCAFTRYCSCPFAPVHSVSDLVVDLHSTFFETVTAMV